MSKTTINNVEVRLQYESRAHIGWNDADGNRYHVWIVRDDDGTWHPEDGDEAVVYKNPPRNEDGSHKSHYESGYFRTMKLKLSGATGRAMFPQAMARFPIKLAAAQHEYEAKKAKEAAEQAIAIRNNRIRERAERMYALLEKYAGGAEAIEILGAVDAIIKEVEGP